MPSSYEVWNDLIADSFFNKNELGQDVAFSVDTEVLSAVSDLPKTEAEESLRKAIESLISKSWSIENLIVKVKLWNHSSNRAMENFPAIAFLAFTVLAASKMGEDDSEVASFASHNYYKPLRRLLNQQDESAGAPGNFTDHIEYLWTELSNWLENDLKSSRGNLQITSPKNHRYVELCTQHAILRASDRRRLFEFFEDLEIDDVDFAISEIKQHLDSWCNRREQPWSKRIQMVLRNPDLSLYCDALIKNEIKRYKSRQNYQGSIGSSIRLALDFSDYGADPSLSLVLSANQQHPNTIAFTEDEKYVKKIANWFLPFIIDVNRVREAFANGVTMRMQNSYTFSFDCDSAYIFSYENDLTTWVSRSRAELGTLHCLLVPTSRLAEVELFLRSVCSTDEAEEPTSQQLSENSAAYGWSLIKNVRIDVNFDQATKIPNFLTNIFSFRRGYRLKIAGGLPIGIISNVYLVNGEPRLTLSESSGTKNLFANSPLFGQREFDLTDHGTEVDLWTLKLRKDPNLVGMEPGLFELNDGTSKVTVEIKDAIVEEAGLNADTLFAESFNGTQVKGTWSSQESLRSDPIEVNILYGPAKILYRDGSSDTISQPEWLTKKVGPLSWEKIDAYPKVGKEVTEVYERSKAQRVNIAGRTFKFKSPDEKLNAGDELLRWVSEVGSGTWDQLRQASRYLMERHKINRRDSYLGSSLSKLGHLEIDWVSSTWAVVKPTLNVIPGMGLVVVMTGSRPQVVEDRLKNAANTVDVYALPLQPQQSADQPHIRMLKCADLNEARSVANRLNSRFIIDPASRLAASLIPLEQYPLERAAAPHPNERESVKLYNIDSRSWIQISKLISFNWPDGLYEVPGWGRPRFLVKRGSDWFQTEKTYGMFHEYKRVGIQNVFKWLQMENSESGYLYVDRDVVLPILAERSLVMCSGFSALEINTKIAYINVPREVASEIARRLEQRIRS